MKAAFFDFDDTIVSKSSAGVALMYFYHKGEVGIASILNGFLWGIKHKLNLADGEKMFKAGADMVKGYKEERLKEIMLDVFNEKIVHLIYQEAWDAIQAHIKAGDIVAILSSSPPYLLNLFAKFAGIKHVICSSQVVKDGVMTSELVRPICYGDGKVFWAEKFLKEHNLTWEGSYYYADSNSDSPVFEKVTYPICVNPDPRLRRKAQKKNWKIVNYQKLYDPAKKD